MAHAPDIDAWFGDRARIRVRVWRERDGVCVEVQPARSPGEAARLRIRTRGMPFLCGPGPHVRRWTMVSGLPPPWLAWADPFQWLTRFAGDSMFRATDENRDEEQSFDRTAASRTLRQVREAIRAAAVHAVQRCEPAALANARRFVPCMRWWLYERLVADGGGRLEQLCRAAPGVVIFAFALDEEPTFRSVGRCLLEGVQKGVPLRELLDAALHGWTQRAGSFAPDHSGDLWETLHKTKGAQHDELIRQQRLLIRRAQARVPPTLLLTPPPLWFAPEDIPTGVRANAHWFRVMKGASPTLWHRPNVPAKIGVGLSRFASRHAAAIRPRRRRRVPQIMRRLFTYSLGTGHTPSRATSPTAFVERAEQWHKHFDLLADLVDGDASGTPSTVLDRLLPSHPELRWTTPLLTVTPLRTVRDVLEEGKTMHHCVGAHARSALSGLCTLCHADVRGTPYTLELRPTRRGWFLNEMRGFANERPTAQTLETLRPWLVEHGIYDGNIHVSDPQLELTVGDVPF